MHHSMREGFMDQGQIDLVKHGSAARDVLAQIYPQA
jgi:hypothetical protein